MGRLEFNGEGPRIVSKKYNMDPRTGRFRLTYNVNNAKITNSKGIDNGQRPHSFSSYHSTNSTSNYGSQELSLPRLNTTEKTITGSLGSFIKVLKKGQKGGPFINH